MGDFAGISVPQLKNLFLDVSAARSCLCRIIRDARGKCKPFLAFFRFGGRFWLLCRNGGRPVIDSAGNFV
jgi:hypothetical protein